MADAPSPDTPLPDIPSAFFCTSNPLETTDPSEHYRRIIDAYLNSEEFLSPPGLVDRGHKAPGDRTPINPSDYDLLPSSPRIARPSSKPPLRARPSDRYSFPSKPSPNPASIVPADVKSHYRFTVLTERLIRLESSEDQTFEDRASTFALFRHFDKPNYTVVDTKKSLEITTDFLHLTYDKRPFSFEGLSIKVGKDTWRYDGKSYGDLGGTARTLDQADGRIPLDPGVLSRKSYAVLNDSESMLFDHDGWIAPREAGRKDFYFFAYDGDHKAAIKDFYRLSGSQPMLPRWALGNWWSRYHAYSADEYLELMDHFKREKIPLNVGVIDMDWHKPGWTGYSWNRSLFPDPEGFLRQLHERNLKVALNDHPADGVRSYEDLYEKVARRLSRDPKKGETVYFDCCDREFMDAYFDVLKLEIEKQGVDFWWIDWQQGNRSRIPGIDPLWVLNHYHYLTSQRNLAVLQKPLTFSRYGGPGSHRYPIGFSGDTLISWASLEFQPEFTATASNIGYGWWSHDIGGHYWGTRSNELTARWVQLGCFSPILRLHSEKSEWNSKEPWLYEPEAAAVMKDYLILRHQLIPFLYTMNHRASFEGEPLVQPMYWNHKDAAAYTVPNQYYFGPGMIVAPITKPHSPTTLLGGVRAWLPPGRYTDLFHPGLVYDGNRYMHLHRSLSEIPVLAKEGTIIPLDTSPNLENGSPRPVEITILLVVGADAYFELIEEVPIEDDDSDLDSNDLDSNDSDYFDLDDEPPVSGEGITKLPAPPRRPPRTTISRTPITWQQKTGILTIGPASDSDKTKPDTTRVWKIKLVGHVSARTKFAAVDRVTSWDKVTRDAHSTTVDLGTFSLLRPDMFRVELGRDIQLDVVDIPASAHEMLYRCEMGYRMKAAVWDLVVSRGESVEKRVEKLRRLDIVPELRDAVMEIWASDSRAAGHANGLETWSVVFDDMRQRSVQQPGGKVDSTDVKVEMGVPILDDDDEDDDDEDDDYEILSAADIEFEEWDLGP
ncbi:glycoside hydrolase family 31 protein [Podospora appendiculata]|uniref:alpha-glucosidase n=1 Tax=Podospora appendiculata TaxID=314037 RepID=A0AAE0X9U8_9PEZI|nr:glycoside hydrolase family 31 protein [Podospora appendiculata]